METHAEQTAEIELTPLVDWANAPTVRDLQQNLEDAHKDDFAYRAKVRRWLDYRNIEGEATPKKIVGRSSVAPKLIRKQAEWRYSSLEEPFLSTDNLFTVRPTTAGDIERSRQNSLILNNQFDTQIDKVKFIGDYVRDAVDTGRVIVEVGWVTEEVPVTRIVPEYTYVPADDLALAEQYIQLAQLKLQSEDLYFNRVDEGIDKAIMIYAETGQLYAAEQTSEVEVQEVVEVKNQPWIEVCESENILIDPSCGGNIEKAQFIGKKHKASLSDLRKDGRYSNLDQLLIESANPIHDPDFKDSSDIHTFAFEDKPRKQFVVNSYWGYWDIDGDGITVPFVASWVGNTMIRLEKQPFPFNQPPFATAVYMPIRRSVNGEPDAELLIENQRVVGATMRGMVDLLARSANAQTGTKTGFLDASNERRYARGENYKFQANGDPRHSVYQHTFPEIPQSAYNMLTLMNTEAESLTGVKAFASGINSQALGNTVGGGRDALDAASKREAGILRRLAKGILDIGRMIIAMNAEWLSEEEVIRVTDNEFIKVRRDDLAGKYDLKLNISTAEDNHRRAQELAFMLQTTGPNGDPGEVRLIRAEIARLRNMPELAQRIENYKPEPDPVAMQEMELKFKLLEAQIAKEQMLALKHRTEAEANGYRGVKDGAQAELNMAKAGTESAKIRNMHSDSDNKDLDYLQKYNNVGHRQEIEKKNVDALNEISKEAIKTRLAGKDKKE